MKRILVIDDEELTLCLLRNLLEGEGYEVVEARDGESGLKLYLESPADLVITDMIMPVKDGLKTIQELRRIDENVPVIAVSGGGAVAKERYLAIASYLNNVKPLAKPFTKQAVVGLVKELLT